jgi:hypothetical protein
VAFAHVARPSEVHLEGSLGRGGRAMARPACSGMEQSSRARKSTRELTAKVLYALERRVIQAESEVRR